MKVAIISPVSCLEELSAQSTTQMALAHLVLSNNKYSEFYAKMRHRGDHIILDNGFHELRESMTGMQIFEAFKRIDGADVVIAPDHWPERKRTEHLTLEFLNSSAYNLMRTYYDDCEVMYVAHGEDIDDFKRDADFAMSYKFKLVGLSSDSASIIKRAEIVETMRIAGYTGDFHFLGTGYRPCEVMYEAEKLGVYSLDTGSFVKHILRGISLICDERQPPSLDIENEVIHTDRLEEAKHLVGILLKELDGLGCR